MSPEHSSKFSGLPGYPLAGIPELRRTRPGRDSAGQGWIGLVANRSFVVTGLTQVPLLPGFLVLILVVGGLMTAWYREGREGAANACNARSRLRTRSAMNP